MLRVTEDLVLILALSDISESLTDWEGRGRVNDDSDYGEGKVLKAKKIRMQSPYIRKYTETETETHTYIHTKILIHTVPYINGHQ